MIEDINNIWYVPLLNNDITQYNNVLQSKMIQGIEYLKTKLEAQL